MGISSAARGLNPLILLKLLPSPTTLHPPAPVRALMHHSTPLEAKVAEKQ